MKRILIVAIGLLMSSMATGQTKDQEWVFGLSGSFVNFGDGGANSRLSE